MSRKWREKVVQVCGKCKITSVYECEADQPDNNFRIQATTAVRRAESSSFQAARSRPEEDAREAPSKSVAVEHLLRCTRMSDLFDLTIMAWVLCRASRIEEDRRKSSHHDIKRVAIKLGQLLGEIRRMAGSIHVCHWAIASTKTWHLLLAHNGCPERFDEYIHTRRENAEPRSRHGATDQNVERRYWREDKRGTSPSPPTPTVCPSQGRVGKEAPWTVSGTMDNGKDENE